MNKWQEREREREREGLPVRKQADQQNQQPSLSGQGEDGSEVLSPPVPSTCCHGDHLTGFGCQFQCALFLAPLASAPRVEARGANTRILLTHGGKGQRRCCLSWQTERQTETPHLLTYSPLPPQLPRLLITLPVQDGWHVCGKVDAWQHACLCHICNWQLVEY